jgi:hypothetical protein
MSFNVLAEEQWWLEFASLFIGGSKAKRRFRSLFCLSPIMVAWLWHFIEEKGIESNVIFGATELLECLLFLRSPGESWSYGASRFFRDERTFRVNVWTAMKIINSVLPNVSGLF